VLGASPGAPAAASAPPELPELLEFPELPELLPAVFALPGVELPELSEPELSEPELSEPELLEPELPEPELPEPELPVWLAGARGVSRSADSAFTPRVGAPPSDGDSEPAPPIPGELAFWLGRRGAPPASVREPGVPASHSRPAQTRSASPMPSTALQPRPNPPQSAKARRLGHSARCDAGFVRAAPESS
jgi:hypothetical protein